MSGTELNPTSPLLVMLMVNTIFSVTAAGRSAGETISLDRMNDGLRWMTMASSVSECEPPTGSQPVAVTIFVRLPLTTSATTTVLASPASKVPTRLVEGMNRSTSVTLVNVTSPSFRTTR